MTPMQNRVFLNIGPMLLDVLCLCSAFPVALAPAMLLHETIFPVRLLWVPLSFCLLFVLVMYSRGMYNKTTFTYRDRILKNVAISILVALVFTFSMLVFTLDTPGRDDFFAFYVLVALVLLSVRYMLAREGRASHNYTPRVLFIGCSAMIREYLYYLNKTSFHVLPIGYVPLEGDPAVPQLKRMGEMKDVRELIQFEVIDEVVFALPNRCVMQMDDLIQYCTRRGKTVKVVPGLYQTEAAYMHFHSLGTMPVVMYHNYTQTTTQSFIKRTMDLVAGILGLLPLGLLLLVAIPSSLYRNKRPIFLRTRRVGVNGRFFQSYTLNTGLGETAFNRFLIRTGLEKLPKVLNILKGDISLVGTRITLPEELSEYTDEQYSRMVVKPGITGLWYLNNYDRNLSPAEENRMDMEYIRKWTLGQDIRILLLSPLMGLVRSMTHGKRTQGGSP